MSTVKLPTACDSQASDALLAELIEASGQMAIVIDASQVEKVGQACFQILVSATRTAGGISIHNPSEAFTSAVKLAGLGPALAMEFV